MKRLKGKIALKTRWDDARSPAPMLTDEAQELLAKILDVPRGEVGPDYMKKALERPGLYDGLGAPSAKNKTVWEALEELKSS